MNGKLLLAGLPLLADEADGFQLIDATFGDAEGKNNRPRRKEPAKTAAVRKWMVRWSLGCIFGCIFVPEWGVFTRMRDRRTY